LKKIELQLDSVNVEVRHGFFFFLFEEKKKKIGNTEADKNRARIVFKDDVEKKKEKERKSTKG